MQFTSNEGVGMRCIGGVLLLAVVMGSNACYHATVETGATPSTQTVEKGWASGWVYGLVPPSTVSTASRCPNGVAKVETQVSFGNQLVGFLTLGIYTPMEIKVTCAAARSGGSPEAEVLIRAKEGGVALALGEAATLSAKLQKAVLVQF